MNEEKVMGYCAECKKFYPSKNKPFEQCPDGHDLLHPNKCSLCGFTMYFQCDDDYCGPAGPTVCQNCALKQSEGEKHE